MRKLALHRWTKTSGIKQARMPCKGPVQDLAVYSMVGFLHTFQRQVRLERIR